MKPWLVGVLISHTAILFLAGYAGYKQDNFSAGSMLLMAVLAFIGYAVGRGARELVSAFF